MFRPFTGSHVLLYYTMCKSRISEKFNKVSIRTARRTNNHCLFDSEDRGFELRKFEVRTSSRRVA